MFSTISGFSSEDATSTHPSWCDNQQSPNLTKCPLWQNCSQLRTTAGEIMLMGLQGERVVKDWNSITSFIFGCLHADRHIFRNSWTGTSVYRRSTRLLLCSSSDSSITAWLTFLCLVLKILVWMKNDFCSRGTPGTSGESLAWMKLNIHQHYLWTLYQ